MAVTVAAPTLQYVGTYTAKLKPPIQTGGPPWKSPPSASKIMRVPNVPRESVARY
jgi:hypothetical protein